MRRLIFTVLAGSVLLSYPTQVPGQDLEVFDIEDFVDPALLELLGEGQEAQAFTTLSFMLGVGRDLQIRSDFEEGDFSFVRVAGDLFYRDWQFGLGVLANDQRSRGNRTDDRVTFEVGRYLTTNPYVVVLEEEQSQILVRYITRARLAWDWEQHPGGGDGHVLSLDLDIRRDGPQPKVRRADGSERELPVDVIGGYTYTWVEAGEGDNGHDRHYLSLDYRFPFWVYQNGARLLWGLGLGIERTLGHSRWGAARAEIGVEAPIRPLHSQVRFSWAPAYQLDQGELNHEFAILFNPPVLSKIFSPPLRRSLSTPASGR